MATLLQYGAKHHYLIEKMYESYPVETFETLKLAMENKVIKQKAYAYSYLPKTLSEGRLKTIDFLRKIELHFFLSRKHHDLIFIPLSW